MQNQAVFYRSISLELENPEIIIDPNKIK
ncbi:hypothetical protein ACDX78_12445 [Virgibacillus oceani]